MEKKIIKLPEEFEVQCRPILGNEWDQFIEALSLEPSVSIRINSKKYTDYSPCAYIDNLNSGQNVVPWCKTGVYLNERPQFTMDPMLHAGLYYVQEASSMFLQQALEQYVDSDATVLDMCAAPGGKSTVISAYLSEKGMLVSNEYVPQRAHILVENISKWGIPNSVVTNNAPIHFEKLRETFDVIVVDAPCSGEGMFRKDSNAIAEWSLDNIQKCVERQRKILESAWVALKPGGKLIYSTCTYNRRENEEQIEWMVNYLDAEYLPIKVNANWKVTETSMGYRFLPHKTKGEGLFMAIVKKPEGTYSKNRYKLPKKFPETKDELLSWVIGGKEKYKTILWKDIFYAVQKERYEFMIRLLENLNVMNFAIPLAETKGKNLIPQAGLALSTELQRGIFQEVDLDYEGAISYLRTEALILDGIPKGFVLITFKNIPLGWVKNIGNRSNNLYPEHWRIRKQLSK